MRRIKIILTLSLNIATILFLIFIYVNNYGLAAYFFAFFVYAVAAAFILITWEENSRLKDRLQQAEKKVKNLRQFIDDHKKRDKKKESSERMTLKNT